ncbi:MAG TPA: MFS transporter [bacterium]|nr:MFS transporter [bacterium]
MNGTSAAWRIAIVLGIGQLGFATVIPLLPLHLTERLGASVRLVGVVVATVALVETFFKTAWGGVADRHGPRPVMIAGLVLSSVAPLIMSVLRVPILFVPLRFIDGLGSAALLPAAATAIADATTPDRRATGMAVLNMLFLIGLGLGPVLGLFVAGFAGDFRAGFYLASWLLAAAAVLAVIIFPRGRRRVHPDAQVAYHSTLHPAGLSGVVSVLRLSPLLASLYLVAFVQMFGVGLLVPIAAIYAKRVMGLSEHAIGVVLFAVVMAIALASVPAGRLADRVGKLRLIVAGLVPGTLGMWLIPFSERLWLLIIAGALLGVSYALWAPAWLAAISELAPAGNLGLAMGASETVQGLGLVLGPLLGGLLWDALGPQAPFITSAVVLTIGTIIAARTIRENPTS